MTSKIEEIMAKVLDEVYGESALHPEVGKGQIDALDAAGLKVLPKEATGQMQAASVKPMNAIRFGDGAVVLNDAVLVWREMSAAFDPNTWKPAE